MQRVHAEVLTVAVSRELTKNSNVTNNASGLENGKYVLAICFFQGWKCVPFTR